MALDDRQSPIATVGLFDAGGHCDPGILLADVSTDERQRYAAMCRAHRPQQYLASRWLLRRHLAWQLNLDPRDVPLQYPDRGPPVLAGTAIHLGLSHSRGVCLCIGARHTQVGCDVEIQRPRSHKVARLAAHCFHPAEAAQIGAARGPQRLSDFYRLWTLKEAGLKALGRGLAHGLQQPSFSLRPVFAGRQAHDSGPWTFAAGEVTQNDRHYSLALAIRARAATFTVYRYSPAASDGAGQRLELSWDVAFSE